MSEEKYGQGHEKWRPQKPCNCKDVLCYRCAGCIRTKCNKACECTEGLLTRHIYLQQLKNHQQATRPVRETVQQNTEANQRILHRLIQSSMTPTSSQADSEYDGNIPDTFPELNSIEDVMQATKQSLSTGFLSEYIPSKNDRLESRDSLVPLLSTTTRTKTARMKNQRWNNLKQTFKNAANYIEEIFLPNAGGALIESAFGMSNMRLPPGDNNKLNNFTQQFQESCTSIYAQSQRNSVEGKVARAILCNSLPQNVVESNLNSNDEHPVSFKRTAQESAATDYATMMKGKLLHSSYNTTSLARFNKDAVKEAIKFILSEENLSVLSWGAKEIKLSKEETVVLSGMTRCKKRSDIYSDYKEYWKEHSLSHISRSAFYDILNTITTGEEKKISAVDYVVGILVNETCEVLQEIINKFCSAEEKKMLTKHLTVVKNFLKHHYAEHAKQSDTSCGTHGLEYGLRKPTQEDLDIPSSNLPSVDCESCKFVDFFIWEMLEMLEKRKKNCDRNLRVSIIDAIQYVKDTDEKFVCFMQHRMRVANSEQSLAEIEKEMAIQCKRNKTDCAEALAIIDWKMKFNTDAARQTTEEHFGKRGISWHGLLLIFYCYDAKEDKAVRHTSYIDQIQEGSNLQSGPHCLSMLEAAMIEIGESIPHLNSIILQSDNAGCYHHKMMKLGPLLLNETLRVKISRYTHTETQAGKSLLDAHFGRCRVFLDRYLTTAIPNVITRIATACGLTKGLAWRGGIKNSAVQLIRHDAICLEEMEEEMSTIIDESKKDFTRCNDIFYPNKKEKDGSYVITVYAYSNIGPGTQFRVNFEKKTWMKVTAGDSQEDTSEISEIDEDETEQQEIEKEDFNPDDDQQDTMEPAVVTGPDFVLKSIEDVDDDRNADNEETDETPTSEKEASLERLFAAEEDTDGEYTLRQLEKVLSAPKKLEQPPLDSTYQSEKHKTKVEIVLMTPLGIIYPPEPKRKIQVDEDLSEVQEVPQVVQKAISNTGEVQASPLHGEKQNKKRKLDSMSPLSLSSAPRPSHIRESQDSIIAPALSQPEYSKLMPPPGQNMQAPPTLTQLSEEVSGGSGETQATTKTVFSVATLIRARNKTLKAFAVRRANQYIGVSRKMVSRFSKGDSDKYEEEFAVMKNSKKYKYPIRKLPRQGHARRSVRGDVQLYGAAYIKKYKKDVEEFFKQEKKTKSLQYSAADMHEKLKAKYPNTFCLPSIHELRNEISSYVSKKKKQNKDNDETGPETEMDSNPDNNEKIEEEREEQQKKFPPEYRKILEEWCRKDTSLTPTPALAKLKKKYHKKRNFPEDKVIKARVSQIRGKIKREMRRDLP